MGPPSPFYRHMTPALSVGSTAVITILMSHVMIYFKLDATRRFARQGGREALQAMCLCRRLSGARGASAL